MTVEFLFDFGSPNAYFAHKVIPGIEKRTGAKFNYVPVYVGRSLQTHQQQAADGRVRRHQEQDAL